MSALRHFKCVRLLGLLGLLSLLGLGSACVQSVEVWSARPVDQGVELGPELGIADQRALDMDEDGGDLSSPRLIPPGCPATTRFDAPGAWQWVVVGDGLTSYTRDGITWIDERFASPSPEKGDGRTRLRHVYYTGSSWVAVGGLDNPLISRSCDGITWSHDLFNATSDEQIMALPTHHQHGLRALTRFGNELYAVGRDGIVMRSKDDGITWSVMRGGAINGGLSGIVEFQGRLIAVGNLWGRGDAELGDPMESDGIIFESADGVDWSKSQDFADSWFAYGVVANDRFILAAGWESCWLSWDARDWQPCELDQLYPELAPHQLLSIQQWQGRIIVVYKGGYWLESLDGRSWSSPQNKNMFLSNPFIVQGPDRAVATGIRRRGYSLNGIDWMFQDAPDYLSAPALGQQPAP